MKYGDESPSAGIIALEKLFGVYAAIEAYKMAYDKKKDEQGANKKAADYGHIVPPARTKTEVKDNDKEIARLEAELEKLTLRQDIDLSELLVFFLNANIAHLNDIKSFHLKIQRILSDEMADEIIRLNILIDEVTKETKKLEDEQRALGIPVNVSKGYMQQFLELQEQIKKLKAKNAGFATTKKNADATKAGTRMRKRKPAIYYPKGHK